MKLETFNNLSRFGEIIHFQTTRDGGFSQGVYSSLNMTYSSGDDESAVLKNRKQLANTLKLNIENFVFSHQSHSSGVKIITSGDRGTGVYNTGVAFRDIDAMITNESEIVLCIKIGDCIPILCYDPTKKVIGAIHAGWIGTAKKITQKTIGMMVESFGCSPSDIVVGIGAGAGICCYEVDEAVFTKVRMSIEGYQGTDYFERAGDKYQIDLKRINSIQMQEIGVLESNIEINPDCTICMNDKYFSHRAAHGNRSGQTACGISLI